MKLKCNHCPSTYDSDDALEILTVSAGDAMKPTEMELAEILVANGPLLLSEIEALERRELGARGGKLSSRYMHRLVGSMNQQLEEFPYAVFHCSTQIAPGEKGDPLLLIFPVPETEFAALPDIEVHAMTATLGMRPESADSRSEVETGGAADTGSVEQIAHGDVPLPVDFT